MKRVKGERSDEMMKLSREQEDAARTDGQREKHIKAKVGGLDKMKEGGRERKGVQLHLPLALVGNSTPLYSVPFSSQLRKR